MTTYYVGKGGNDGNSGLTWALRKLTLNGAEDIPVAAGDTVIVGAGTYRELLLIDVSGSAGNLIWYIGDVTGRLTDGIGGIVRITGSDDDITPGARNYCIQPSAAAARSYRGYRGFHMDGVTAAGRLLDLTTSSSNCIVEDCIFATADTATASIYTSGSASTGNIIRRCTFSGYAINGQIYLLQSPSNNDVDTLIENCRFIGVGGAGAAIEYQGCGGVTIKNVTVIGALYGVYGYSLPGAGAMCYVYNSVFAGMDIGVNGGGAARTTEDYNRFYRCSTAAVSGATSGGNSVTGAVLFDMPLLRSSLQMSWNPGALSPWSECIRVAQTAMPTDDLFGIVRPATAAKASQGAIQFQPAERDGTVYYGAEGASLLMEDAGSKTFLAPVTAVETVLSVMVRRGANYAGNLPRVIISQPGQADITVTDVGASSAWNELTHTWTPAALPTWVQIQLESQNTAGAGDYVVNWDDLKLTVG